MTTDRTLARSMRHIADEARPVHLPADLWRRGRRRRRRRIAAAGAALAVLVAVLVAVPFAVDRSGPRAIEPADGPASIPSTVYPPLPLQRTVQQAPNGPATLLVSGGGQFQGGDLLYRYDDRSMVVGRDGYYRMVRGATRKEAGDSLLLSPDGRYVASDAGLEGAGDGPATAVLDLTTGDVRTYAGARPLAWSPDSRRLLAHGDDTVIHLIDRESGAAREVTRLPAVRVAFAPDGRRFVAEAGSALTIVDVDTGATRELTRLEKVERLAGPAAWRPDGRITLASAFGCTSACSRDDLRGREVNLRFLDERSGERIHGASFFGLNGVLGMRLLGWRSNGTPVVAVFDLIRNADEYPVSRWPLDGPEWQQDDTFLRGGVRLMVLDRDTPTGTELVRLPESALNVEVARDLVASERFGGPAPSRSDRFRDMLGPMVPQLLLLGLGLAALVAVRPIFRRVRRRASRMREEV